MKKQFNIILDKLKKIDRKKFFVVFIMGLSILIVYIVPIAIKRYEELPDVRLRNMKNNGMLAIMIPDDKGSYKEYMGIEASDTHIAQDKNSFPKGYALNVGKSYCIDKDGQEVKEVISLGAHGGVQIRTNKEVYCTLYFDYPSADLLFYNNIVKIPPNCTGDQCQEVSYTNCTDVQCALDELYTVIHGSLPDSDE